MVNQKFMQPNLSLSTPYRISSEPLYVDVEQFLGLLRFEMREKLMDMPGDVLKTRLAR